MADKEPESFMGIDIFKQILSGEDATKGAETAVRKLRFYSTAIGMIGATRICTFLNPILDCLTDETKQTIKDDINGLPLYLGKGADFLESKLKK